MKYKFEGKPSLSIPLHTLIYNYTRIIAAMKSFYKKFVTGSRYLPPNLFYAVIWNRLF